MKDLILMDAISELDADLLEEHLAQKEKLKTKAKRKKKARFIKWAAIAACACLVIGVSMSGFLFGPDNKGDDPNGNKGDAPNGNKGDENVSDSFSLYCDSLADLKKEAAGRLLFGDDPNGGNVLWYAFIKKLCLQPITAPHLNGEVIEFRNEDGFPNIIFRSSELYGLPWIVYYPKVSTGENFYIQITYIPDDIMEKLNDPTASEVIKELAPDSSNIEHFGKYDTSVYEREINLRDREVTALLYEYRNDSRSSIIFVYGDMLVMIRSDMEVWNEQWFSELSFEGFEE